MRPHSQKSPSPRDSAHSQTSCRSGVVMQKLAYSASPLVMSNQPSADYMKTNPKSAAPLEPFVCDGALDEAIANGLRRAGNRRSLNGSQLKIANCDLAANSGSLMARAMARMVRRRLPKTYGMCSKFTTRARLLSSSSDTSLDSVSPQNAD
ncbi:hypothetical protein DFH11DRAFT_1879441, partial [Phellopilus nigrolimitatus]